MVARIIALLQNRREQRETARIVCGVQKIFQHYQETAWITRRSGYERNTVTTQRDDSFWYSQIWGIQPLLRCPCEVN